MSCISGVGGDVPSLVKIAKSGRSILAIDSCSLRCVGHTLARHGVRPSAHLVLSNFGVKKRFHREFDQNEAAAVYRSALAGIASIEACPGPVNPLPCRHSASPSTDHATSAAEPESIDVEQTTVSRKKVRNIEF